MACSAARRGAARTAERAAGYLYGKRTCYVWRAQGGAAVCFGLKCVRQLMGLFWMTQTTRDWLRSAQLALFWMTQIIPQSFDPS